MTEIAPLPPPVIRATPASGTPASPTHAPDVEIVPASPPAPPTRSPEASGERRAALQQQIDRVLENADTSLRFRVDDVSDRIVVSVLDGSGEVILQIPDETALAVARRLALTGSLLEASA